MGIFLSIVAVLIALMVIRKLLKGDSNTEKSEATNIAKIEAETGKQIDVEQVAKAKAVSNYSLGKMYDRGENVPKNYKKALQYYRMAAEQGFAMAQNSLGEMYMHGSGVPQDYKEAIKWCQLAAEQGLGVAQINLGTMYLNAPDVPQNPVMSYFWITIAIENSEGDRKNFVCKPLLDYPKSLMNSSQIAEAEELARKYIENKLKEC